MTLEDQIRQSWGGYGEWDAAGVDRVAELAGLLRARGISSLGDLQLVTGDPRNVGVNQVGMGDGAGGGEVPMYASGNRVRLGGQEYGFLGDISNDGTYSGPQSWLTDGDKTYLGNNDLLAWSAQGKGSVGYQIVPTGNGYAVAPTWASSSDAGRFRDYAKGTAGVAAAIGGAHLLNGAIGGAGLGGGSGAFLGEGVASGVGAWDAAAGLGGAGGAGAAGIGAAGGSGAGGMGLFSGISGGDWLRLGTDLLGGFMQNRSANNAIDAQSAASREANALQKYMYDTTRADYQPFREAGYSALNWLQGLLNNPQSVRQDPGYRFQRDEGINALENSATARGVTYSGAQAKALQRFGNDYATNKLNESYNRLASIAGIGQQATGSVANAGQGYANNVGNNLIGMGNANAAAALMRGSTYQNMLGSLGATLGRPRAPTYPTLNGQPWGGPADDPWYG